MVRPTLLCIALFLCFVSELPSEPQPITQGLMGKVVDSYSEPVGTALIIVHSDKEQTASVFSTNPAGDFEIRLSLGTYDVMATARGFVPVCKRIIVISGSVQKFSPKLHADVEHMEN